MRAGMFNGGSREMRDVGKTSAAAGCAAIILVVGLWVTGIVLSLAVSAAIVYGVWLLCKSFGHGG